MTTGLALVGGYEQALPIQMAMIDIFEVGTGGGSIAGLDEGGALRVGPASAGAEPGPACYGRGGSRPTVTDANLVLGRLGVESFLGGELKLDLAAARTALQTHVADPLGISVIEAADGILRIAATAMSYAVKGVSTERGLDAAAFPLVAYGGAGPLHAAQIAREIGTATVIIPRAPGHFCAFGMLFSDLRTDFVRTCPARLATLEFAGIERIYVELENEGRAALAPSAALMKTIRITRAADMRYVGQEHAVAVQLPAALFAAEDRDAIKRLFDIEHERRYGTNAPGEPSEIVSVRVSVSGVMEKPALERIDAGASTPTADATRLERPVYFPGGGRPVPSPVFVRDALRAGNRIEGPAIIEEHASTTVVFPGDIVTVDAFGNLVIEIGRTNM